MAFSIESFDGIRQALCACGTGQCKHGTLIAATVLPTVEELQAEIEGHKAENTRLHEMLNERLGLVK